MRSVVGEEVFLRGDRIRRVGISKARQEVIRQSAGPNVGQRNVDPSLALVDNAPENIPVESSIHLV